MWTALRSIKQVFLRKTAFISFTLECAMEAKQLQETSSKSRGPTNKAADFCCDRAVSAVLADTGESPDRGKAVGRLAPGPVLFRAEEGGLSKASRVELKGPCPEERCPLYLQPFWELLPQVQGRCEGEHGGCLASEQPRFTLTNTLQ